MTPIHQSLSWPANKQNLGSEILPIESQSWRVWSIQKSGPRLSILFFEFLINALIPRVFDELQDKYKKLQQNPPSEPVSMFMVNWGKLFLSSLKSLDFDEAYKLPAEQLRLHSTVARVETLSYVPPNEQKTLYESTKKHIQDVTIPSLPATIDFSVFLTSNGYLLKSQQLIWQAFEAMNHDMLHHQQTPFTLSNADKTFLEKKVEWVASNLDCTGYAFLKLRDTQALDWIRAALQGRKYDVTERFYHGRSISTLQSMNYRIVADPDDGDLIVYFHGQPKSATHTGIYRDSGLIESKLGIGQTNITLHPIENVSATFGRHFLFFRKTPSVAIESVVSSNSDAYKK